MLLKKNRISRKLFPVVLKAQQKYTSKHMFVRVASFSHKTKTFPLKVSFVVSKKHTKTAVQRHMLRRLGYNTIQKEIKKLKEGFLVAFFFTQNMEKVSKKEIQQEIYKLLEKAGLYI